MTRTFHLTILLALSLCFFTRMAHAQDEIEDTISLKQNELVSPVDSFQTNVMNKLDWTPKPQPKAGDTTKIVIYLTFDDGPQSGTEKVYNICKRLGVRSSFFVIGINDSGATGTLKNAIANINSMYPEMVICNHSYTHANERYRYFYEHPTMAEQDFYKAQATINPHYKIIRLPGNSAWVRRRELMSTKLVKPVVRLLDSAGYDIIGWDVEWNFSHKDSRPIQTAEQMVADVEDAIRNKNTHVKKHVVILSHDRMFRYNSDAALLEKFIMLLKQNTIYVFDTIDNYPRLKREENVATAMRVKTPPHL